MECRAPEADEVPDAEPALAPASHSANPVGDIISQASHAFGEPGVPNHQRASYSRKPVGFTSTARMPRYMGHSAACSRDEPWP